MSTTHVLVLLTCLAANRSAPTPAEGVAGRPDALLIVVFAGITLLDRVFDQLEYHTFMLQRNA